MSSETIPPTPPETSQTAAQTGKADSTVKPAPAVPTVKVGPPLKASKSAAEIQAMPAKITKTGLRGTIADLQAALAASNHPDSLKAALSVELAASGAKAAVLDVHRHEMEGKNGKTVVGHWTITPLF